MTGWQIALWVLSIVMFFIAGWYKGLQGGYHLGKEATIKALGKYIDKAADAHGMNDGDEVTVKFSKAKLAKDADTWMQDREANDD